MIKAAANEQLPVVHPEQPGFAGITIGQLSGPAHDPANSRAERGHRLDRDARLGATRDLDRRDRPLAVRHRDVGEDGDAPRARARWPSARSSGTRASSARSSPGGSSRRRRSASTGRSSRRSPARPGSPGSPATSSTRPTRSPTASRSATSGSRAGRSGRSASSGVAGSPEDQGQAGSGVDRRGPPSRRGPSPSAAKNATRRAEMMRGSLHGQSGTRHAGRTGGSVALWRSRLMSIARLRSSGSGRKPRRLGSNASPGRITDASDPFRGSIARTTDIQVGVGPHRW